MKFSRSKASLEPVEAAKIAKIRRLKMRLKRPAASIRSPHHFYKCGGNLQKSGYYFSYLYILLLILKSFYMDNTQKAEIPTLAALPALLPTTTTECISQHLEQLSAIPNDLIRLHM